jgi:hypothetical protein
MYKMFLSIAVTLAGPAGLANAQIQRRAELTGGGNGDRGKCTVEVVVDGAVEVEIRGDNATLRNLSGQQPQFRRFQCTGPVPLNPADFRFSGVDGRGRQELIRDPRNGGVAVIRIEDPQSGTEGYTFDLTWSGGGESSGSRYPVEQSRGAQIPVVPSYPGGQAPNRQYPGDQDRDRQPPDRVDERGRQANRQFTTDQAIQVCQDAVRNEAAGRFHARDIDFHRTGIDDNPSRRDWVMGTFALRRSYNGSKTFRFSCSVDFETGRVRSTDIQPLEGRR